MKRFSFFIVGLICLGSSAYANRRYSSPVVSAARSSQRTPLRYPIPKASKQQISVKTPDIYEPSEPLIRHVVLNRKKIPNSEQLVRFVLRFSSLTPDTKDLELFEYKKKVVFKFFYPINLEPPVVRILSADIAKTLEMSENFAIPVRLDRAETQLIAPNDFSQFFERRKTEFAKTRIYEGLLHFSISETPVEELLDFLIMIHSSKTHPEEYSMEKEEFKIYLMTSEDHLLHQIQERIFRINELKLSLSEDEYNNKLVFWLKLLNQASTLRHFSLSSLNFFPGFLEGNK